MAYRKYHNRPVTVDGLRFDSVHEANRYRHLSILERAGTIHDLQRQVKYILIPAQYDEAETGETYQSGPRKGQPKIRRVCLEKECSYYADFVYTEDGKVVVEDTKGAKTKDYIIKRKLMLYVHGIRIREI